MFDKLRLKEVLTEYKRDFTAFEWSREKYKWEAIKTFRAHWKENDPDFAEMLSQSLSKTKNLLAAANYYPAGMITKFAKAAPEEVRAMFSALYDESTDVVERILTFKNESTTLLKKYGNGDRQHYQNENAISVYLWLYDPDKYYIYKFNEVKTVAEVLGCDYRFKKGAYRENLRNFYRLYDELCEYICTDTELTGLLQTQLSDSCYSDPEYKTLTVDVGFYISRYYSQKEVTISQEQPLNDCSSNLPNYVPRAMEKSAAYQAYTAEDFLRQVFMSEQRHDRLVAVLKNKKNIILQGAPGVGKTYAAKRLAYSIMGEQDESRVELVQFHQNYSYEDFVMGYKPSENGFKLKTGVFYQFCQKAADQPGKDFFFIIDEINRGNMSKIFGELLMLIENDYRGTAATLAYNGKPFSVPENLYIIGMMNTADRSLAMIDYALRRRFSFFEMQPGFDSEGFVQYQTKLNNETFDRLIETVKELNREIANDRSLGKGFCIGHSYFSNWRECTDEKMQTVVDFDIIPMLEEYWFDDAARLQRWSNLLHGVFQ